MDTTVQNIISKLESKDNDVRSDAITDLALILEMHSWNLTYDQRVSKYSTFLDDRLIDVTLSQQDQQEVVSFIKILVLRQDTLNGSLIWAIGKSLPHLGLLPLLDIIENQSLTFSSDEIYQLMMALSNLIFSGTSESLNEEHRQAMAQSDLSQFLEKVISSNFTYLYQNIVRLISKWEELMGRSAIIGGVF